jgi:hypothetical protein
MRTRTQRTHATQRLVYGLNCVIRPHGAARLASLLDVIYEEDSSMGFFQDFGFWIFLALLDFGLCSFPKTYLDSIFRSLARSGLV